LRDLRLTLSSSSRGSFEGGLTLQPKTFLPQLPMALVVALVGILVPLAFTFALFSASTFDYPPLEAFTAGSALASTSLGTVRPPSFTPYLGPSVARGTLEGLVTDAAIQTRLVSSSSPPH